MQAIYGYDEHDLMVVDTSAMVSVIEAEASWQRFFDAMAEAPQLSMSIPTWVEFGIVAIARLRPGTQDEAATLCEDLEVQFVPLDTDFEPALQV